MKIPHIIIGVFVLFAGFIGQFVYRSTQHKVNLVSEDYYAREIDYQRQIDTERRSKALDTEFVMNYVAEANQLKITLPNHGAPVDGQVIFYRPSDSDLDLSIPLKSREREVALSTAKIPSGHWEVQVRYSVNGKEYYFTKSVLIG